LKSLDNYQQLTIRISKVLNPKNNVDNGHGYRWLIRCDEIPGCLGYGTTVADALRQFQKLARVWINVVK